MSVSIRNVLSPALFALLATGVLAQAAAPATSTETAAATATAAPARSAGQPASADSAEEEISMHVVREQFTELLRNHPDQVSSVLATDPTLLTDQSYVARYPDLAEFLANHPQVLRNPAFYMSSFTVPGSRPQGALTTLIEPLMITTTIAIIAFALTWVVRTVIEQRRWSRLSRTQAEVHNKILDRFGSSDELLNYIKTPAGSKFLESAPIAVRTEQPLQSAPMGRMLWSIQAGIVIAAGSIGLLVVSANVGKEAQEDLFSLGTIGVCIGAGFIVSAIVSMILSRRLGLWQGRAPEPAEDPGLVR